MSSILRMLRTVSAARWTALSETSRGWITFSSRMLVIAPWIKVQNNNNNNRQANKCSNFIKKGKSRPYSITECRVPELIPVLGSQPAGDVSHNLAVGCHYFPPGLQLPSQPLKGCYWFRCPVNTDTMGVNTVKTVTRQHRGCDMNQGPTVPESSTLTTQLPIHAK